MASIAAMSADEKGKDTLFLRDTDGDDRADERTVLFSGWGTGDTPAGPSHLRYGFDNWIWGSVGYSAFNGAVGGEQKRFGSGVFRMKPDGSALEFLRGSVGEGDRVHVVVRSAGDMAGA